MELYTKFVKQFFYILIFCHAAIFQIFMSLFHSAFMFYVCTHNCEYLINGVVCKCKRCISILFPCMPNLFFVIISHPYFMSSTKRKRRDQRIASKPFLSGLLDHQMKMGFPTMWSSGTKPQ